MSYSCETGYFLGTLRRSTNQGDCTRPGVCEEDEYTREVEDEGES